MPAWMLRLPLAAFAPEGPGGPAPLDDSEAADAFLKLLGGDDPARKAGTAQRPHRAPRKAETSPRVQGHQETIPRAQGRPQRPARGKKVARTTRRLNFGSPARTRRARLSSRKCPSSTRHERPPKRPPLKFLRPVRGRRPSFRRRTSRFRR